MAQAPHNEEGRLCSVCGTPFKANSYTGTITRRSADGYIVPKLVCRKCHNDHFSKGE